MLIDPFEIYNSRTADTRGLYGLDFILTQDNEFKLVEANGVCSGMVGFKEIYGDNRVHDRVFDELSEGKPIFLEGINYINSLRSEFSLREKLTNKVYGFKQKYKNKKLMCSDRGLFSWKNDVSLNTSSLYESFRDELSANYKTGSVKIVNAFNFRDSDDYINPYLQEAILENKFCAHILAESSGLIDDGIYLPGSFVGMGITCDLELEKLLSSNNDEFIIKPILGSTGMGVKKISRNDVENFYNTGGFISSPTFIDLFKLKYQNKINKKSIELYLGEENYFFENGISTIQPFIDSKNSSTNGFNCIRAIVCNGKFIDAYMRVSSDEVVNFSRDAKAVRFQSDELSQISEHVVRSLASGCLNYCNSSFKEDMYWKYFESIDRKNTLKNDFINLFDVVNSLHLEK